MGEFKFSLFTTMPIWDSIFLISIQKIAYILENGGVRNITLIFGTFKIGDIIHMWLEVTIRE